MNTLSIIIALSIAATATAVTLNTNFAWKQLDFVWDSLEQRENAIKDGQFIQANNVPLGVARWKNKVFVSMPRWRKGVASALNYVDLDGAPDQPLKPYPSMADNLVPDAAEELPSNRSIISVFRVFVDVCDRLWVQDGGIADVFGARHQITNPSIAIFDLNTDQLIHRHFFTKTGNAFKENSFFGNIVVEVDKDNCDDAYAYAADIARPGIVVYSLKQDASWRVEHLYFHLEPLAGIFNVSGIDFQWTDGVLGMALSEPQPDGYRTMYFHAFSSTKEFSVSTKVLRNWKPENKRELFYEFKYLGDRGPMTQATSSFYDPESKAVFYTQVCRDGVGCWNTNKLYTVENNPLVLNDPTNFEFTADLKLDSEGTLWVLTDKLPRYFYMTLDPDVINFRIMSVKAKDVIAGTTCE
ncbi:L-dopachrome tautomerase yellow-f2-like [Aricia agestis]|uniref:L-dopachrome tautomerase yellow-f2-like n=1 Tax=Aricia agestis TaxID=91739 RepID=UPI001C208FD5|nr:L-dopachrome tautomerase yellow-f2-like [Aricia agestis]